MKQEHLASLPTKEIGVNILYLPSFFISNQFISSPGGHVKLLMLTQARRNQWGRGRRSGAAAPPLPPDFCKSQIDIDRQIINLPYFRSTTCHISAFFSQIFSIDIRNLEASTSSKKRCLLKFRINHRKQTLVLDSPLKLHQKQTLTLEFFVFNAKLLKTSILENISEQVLLKIYPVLLF